MTNTIFLPCARIYKVGDTVLALCLDGSVREFVAPQQEFGFRINAEDAFGPYGRAPAPPELEGWEWALDSLWTHCAINGQDGTQTWYGFASLEQLRFFRTLLEADKVGPKTAFKIVEATRWHVIRDIVARGDREAFLKLKGVGAKTGEKLLPLVFRNQPEAGTAGQTLNAQRATLNAQVTEDAVSALCAMGYKKNDARKTVEEIRAHLGGVPPTTEELIKLALKRRAA